MLKWFTIWIWGRGYTKMVEDDYVIHAERALHNWKLILEEAENWDKAT